MPGETRMRGAARLAPIFDALEVPYAVESRMRLAATPFGHALLQPKGESPEAWRFGGDSLAEITRNYEGFSGPKGPRVRAPAL